MYRRARSAAAGVAADRWTRLSRLDEFRGGKGVATACGAFGVLAPVATVLAVSVFVVVVWVTRHVSLGSIVACAALPSLAYITGSSGAVLIASFAAAALILVRHRSNMVRLASPATESPRLMKTMAVSRRRQLGHGALGASRRRRARRAPLGARRGARRPCSNSNGRTRHICRVSLSGEPASHCRRSAPRSRASTWWYQLFPRTGVAR